MLSLFRRSPVVESAVADWQFDCFAWLLRNGGGFSEFRNTYLVLPTRAHFPQEGLVGHELASALFEQVKTHARLSDWECVLEPQDEDPNPVVAPTLVVQGSPVSAAGTFSVSRNAVVITYNLSELSHPESTIATFAHELAHYFTAVFPELPPGGEDHIEEATDVCSVFFGFGIFAARTCFIFEQFTSVDSQGWRARRQGYLSEPELIHALAIFIVALDIDRKLAIRYLKNHQRGLLKRAIRDVRARQDEIDSLRSIESEPTNVAEET